MPVTVLIHVHNEDSVLAEMDELPSLSDTMIKVTNPRRRDGKDLHYLQPSVVTVLWPLHRVAFIEVLPSEEEEKLIGFVRE